MSGRILSQVSQSVESPLLRSQGDYLVINIAILVAWLLISADSSSIVSRKLLGLQMFSKLIQLSVKY